MIGATCIRDWAAGPNKAKWNCVQFVWHTMCPAEGGWYFSATTIWTLWRNRPQLYCPCVSIVTRGQYGEAAQNEVSWLISLFHPFLWKLKPENAHKDPWRVKDYLNEGFQWTYHVVLQKCEFFCKFSTLAHVKWAIARDGLGWLDSSQCDTC